MITSAEWLLTPLNTQQKNQSHSPKGYRKFDCQAKEAEILARDFWFEHPTHGTKAEDSKSKATTASENVDRRKLTYDHHGKWLEPSLFLMPVQY